MQVRGDWCTLYPAPQLSMTATNSSGNCTYYAAKDLCGSITLAQFKGFCKGGGITLVSWNKFAHEVAAPYCNGFPADLSHNTNSMQEWFTPGTSLHSSWIAGIMDIPVSKRGGHVVAFRWHENGLELYDSRRRFPMVVRVSQGPHLAQRRPSFLDNAKFMLLIQKTRPVKSAEKHKRVTID